MELKVKALSPKIGHEIPAPFYASAGAAAMDLHACLDEPLAIPAGQRRSVPTGLAIALPGGGDIMAGNFINAVVNFLIMAFVVFFIIKALNIFHREKEEAPPAPPEPSAEEKLLTEIRDLLKERKDA